MHNKLEKWFCRVAAFGFICAGVIYGSSKPHVVENVGADDDIVLALGGITVEYDATNDVTKVDVTFSGTCVTTSTPVSVRNAQSEHWRELVKTGATITTDFTVNTLTFYTPGNETGMRYWWVGVDLPAVIIETKGIKITYFEAVSSFVQIVWTCDDPNATEFHIQRRRPGDEEWQTVGITTEHYFIHLGFTVAQTWEWRVISTYTEGGE